MEEMRSEQLTGADLLLHLHAGRREAGEMQAACRQPAAAPALGTLQDFCKGISSDMKKASVCTTMLISDGGLVPGI